MGKLDDADTAVALAYLSDLPEGERSAVQFFMWPPPPRQESAAVSLRRRLLQTDEDFTPEDYDLLSELDSQAARANRKSCSGQAKAAREAVLEQCPKSSLSAGQTGIQCTICLEAIKVGAEVRTLPCLHVFHRKCIDRWVLACPSDTPRCPIDQLELRPRVSTDAPLVSL